ncbi:MAG TPA: prepilin-type N-terminal cleavage/methylation domain-containing protein [Steroidobacteraceae bacterium]|nr:prepilin-type N-terminal cleavage/methylation domain-containing protein [Steroidobacteraceae bacterium]
MTLKSLRARRRRFSRGFTLIELMVVVIIIGICAALATPLLLEQMRERKSRDMAQQIAQLYTSARLRALGRGAAVRVNYNATTGFEVIESIEGTQASVTRGQANCAPTPGMGCLSTNWGPPGAPVNSRLVNRLLWPSNITVQATDPLLTAVTDMNVCFTPGGRSFATPTNAAPTAALTGSVQFAVKRGNGLERKVVLLPNGTARLAL